MGRSQRHRIEEQGFSALGKIYEQGAINDQILKSIGGAIANAQPVLTSINPTTAVKDSADFSLHCIGSGYTADCRILFAGNPEPITLHSATDISTIVKPSLGWGVNQPIPVQVVKGASLPSAAIKYFTFTSALGDAPEGLRQAVTERERGPFNLKRIEPDGEGGAWYVLDRVDIREGDTLRVEASGSSSTNGDFVVGSVSNDVSGETAVYWADPSITADIVGKGRITIL